MSVRLQRLLVVQPPPVAQHQVRQVERVEQEEQEEQVVRQSHHLSNPPK